MAQENISNLNQNHLGDYILNMYQKLNESHKDYFVFELGKRGFYAEISTVARAAIFAHVHNLQLVLKNDRFGFLADQGWNDYYQPFCKEYNEEMSHNVTIFCRACIPGKFMKEILAHRPDRIELGFLKLTGFSNILYFFMNMVARPNQQILTAFQYAQKNINLPTAYNAIHIRRGDKVGWEDTFYPVSSYINQILKSPFSNLPIFIMSDDYQAIIELKAELCKRGLKNSLYTLCKQESNGFDVWDLRKKLNAYNHSNIIDNTQVDFHAHVFENGKNLIIETLIAAKAKIFVGTLKSNVSWAVLALQYNKKDCIMLKSTDLSI
jgi:hypothetical protein